MVLSKPRRRLPRPSVLPGLRAIRRFWRCLAVLRLSEEAALFFLLLENRAVGSFLERTVPVIPEEEDEAGDAEEAALFVLPLENRSVGGCLERTVPVIPEEEEEEEEEEKEEIEVREGEGEDAEEDRGGSCFRSVKSTSSLVLSASSSGLDSPSLSEFSSMSVSLLMEKGARGRSPSFALCCMGAL